MNNNTIYAGEAADKASAAVIFIHGRGGSAEDILSLAAHFHLEDFALVAPAAKGNTWYPQSFLAPPVANEPALTAAVEMLHGTVTQLVEKGINQERIYFMGFSQGACLALEYVARHARRYGGVAAFTGGLIGDKLYTENYSGDFGQTPIFIGTSDPDPHVPLSRVEQSVVQLQSMNAAVTLKVYPGMGHTINNDEINTAAALLFNSKS